MAEMLTIELSANHPALELVSPTANRCPNWVLTGTSFVAPDNRNDIAVAVKTYSDVGHLYLFADALSRDRWIEQLGHRLIHCHINNHRGFYDDHLPLDFPGGVINYKRDVLPLLRALPNPPSLVLEMDDLEYLERSLRYLGR